MGRPKLSSYALCQVSVAALRKLPSDLSPMLSQILFGEGVEILSRRNSAWFRVRCLWDNVIGWVDPKQIYTIREKEMKSFEQSDTFALDYLNGLTSDAYTIPISIGSNLYRCDGLNVKMPFGNFRYQGQIVNLDISKNSSRLLVSLLKRYLHTPYLYGGRSILGIDNTGLIQIVYKMIGVQLPRTITELVTLGEDIGFLNQVEEGDIAFFQDENQELSHVGIVIDSQHIIHVYGKVRIDRYDQQGLYYLPKKRYIFKLRTIRRVFPIKGL